MGHDPSIGNTRKGFLLLELCRGISLLVSWHEAKISSPSQERKTPQSRAFLPLRGGRSINRAYQESQRVPHSYPECSSPSLREPAARYLLLQHSCMGGWTNCGAGQLPEKGSFYWFTQHLCKRLTAPSFTAFTRKCLQYQTKSAEPLNLLLQQLHFEAVWGFFKHLLQTDLKPVALRSSSSVSTFFQLPGWDNSGSVSGRSWSQTRRVIPCTANWLHNGRGANQTGPSILHLCLSKQISSHNKQHSAVDVGKKGEINTTFP